MWSLLSDLARTPKVNYTVVLMETEGVDQARHYQLRPSNLMTAWGVSLLVIAVLSVSVLAFTPLREWIPGYGTEEVRQSARMNALRVQALQDSLAIQQKYVDRLQDLMTGRVRQTAQASEEGEDPARPSPRPERRATPPPSQTSEDWDDHRQPALPVATFPASTSGETQQASSLASLPLPVGPPVENGYPTRGFDPRTGHYAVDVAVPEGSTVRTIGSGYVVLSDWTQDGGYTVAVQHADGYLSVYKHNQRVLKRVGDRVRELEPVAISGNSGEISTGPHLHFELWHHGLAQDPRPYIAGW